MDTAISIDILTTDNTITGHNCPIQFSYIIFDMNGNEKNVEKVFSIIPDEDCMPSVYAAMNVEPGFKGNELEKSLKAIYAILQKAIEKNIYIVGYNVVQFDLKILNWYFENKLHYKPLKFSHDRIIDVMELAKRSVSVTKIGRYPQEIVLYYFMAKNYSHADYFRFKADEPKILRSLYDNRSAKTILELICEEKNLTSFKNVVEFLNTTYSMDYFPFGKYAGHPIHEIYENDIDYLQWVYKNKDIMQKNPALKESLRKLFNAV